MLPRAEAVREARRWVLAAPLEGRRGTAGERLGAGTGASLEFQDRRAYVAGDDVRHVDWRAYGRTDQLLVRQYREEVSPRVELLVDASASMAVGDDKAALAVELPLLLEAAARKAGARVVAVALEDRPRRLGADELERRGLEPRGRRPLAEVLGAARPLLAPGAVRLLVSDFLTATDPEALVRALARDAGGLQLVQLLGRADVDPPADAALRLEDAESGVSVDLVLDARVRTRYLERLERLGASLHDAARRRGAGLVTVAGRADLADAARASLAPAGVVAPA